jgi:hypothetical protein
VVVLETEVHTGDEVRFCLPHDFFLKKDVTHKFLGMDDAFLHLFDCV